MSLKNVKFGRTVSNFGRKMQRFGHSLEPCFRIYHSELSWIGHNLMWLRSYNTEFYIFKLHVCYTFWGIDILAGMLQWLLSVFSVCTQDEERCIFFHNTKSAAFVFCF